MGCLTSYFEIGGHIVECDIIYNTSLPSPKPSVYAAVRPERGRSSASSQASSMPQKTSSSVEDSDPFVSILGQGMIRTGIAILMVPDPVPFVDEIFAAALIGVGAGLVVYSE